MTTVHRAVPIFPVRNLDAALAHYRRLGFETRAYAGGGYAFLTWDDTEIHLGVVPEFRNDAAKHSAYLRVDDADALAASWCESGVELRMPVDTEWGQREGAVVDPDGNVIRFGSPMDGARR